MNKTVYYLILMLLFPQVALAQAYSNPYETSVLGSFIIYFFNSGATLEFGDEIYCTVQSFMYSAKNDPLLNNAVFNTCRETARLKILYIEQHHPIAGLLGAICGYIALAPTAIIYYANYGKPTTPSEIFESAFKIELVEGGICVIGQLFTDGDMSKAIYSMGFGFASGIIRGGGLYFMKRWEIDTDFRWMVGFWVAVVIFGLFYIGSIGKANAGGAGGALKSVFNAASNPPPNVSRYVPDYSPPSMGGSSIGTQYRSNGTQWDGSWHIPNVTPDPSNLSRNFNLHGANYGNKY